MARGFTFEQLSQPGGFGRFARGMTYGLVVVMLGVALVLLLLLVAWIVTGPMAASRYDSAPTCTGAFTDSCRGLTTGQITQASISGGQTDFDVTVDGHSYTSNLTENAAPDLTPGESVGVEIWQGDVVAITLPGGERVITGSSPDWQKSNLVLPVVGAIGGPLLAVFGIVQLRSVRRAVRVARQEAPLRATLPGEIEDFARSIGVRTSGSDTGDDVVIRPTPTGRPLQRRLYWVVGGAAAVLALPLVAAFVVGSAPQTGRAAGSFYGSLIMFPLLVVFVAAVLVYRNLFLRNARIEVTGTELRMVDWTGHARSWPVSSVAGLLFVLVRAGASTQGWKKLLILGPDARTLATFNGGFLAPFDVEQLGKAMRVPLLTEIADPVDSSVLNRRFPGAGSWIELHPGAAGGILVAVLGAAVFAALVLSRFF